MPFKNVVRNPFLTRFNCRKEHIDTIGTYWYYWYILVNIGQYWYILVHIGTIGTCRGGGGQLLHQGDHPPERDLSASLTLGTWPTMLLLITIMMMAVMMRMVVMRMVSRRMVVRRRMAIMAMLKYKPVPEFGVTKGFCHRKMAKSYIFHQSEIPCGTVG